MQNSWVNFQYSGFYDHPLMLASDFDGEMILLAREFDEAQDEYESMYKVFRISKTAFEAHHEPWAKLLEFTQSKIGEVPVPLVQFDPSRRKSLLLESISKHIHQAT